MKLNRSTLHILRWFPSMVIGAMLIGRWGNEPLHWPWILFIAVLAGMLFFAPKHRDAPSIPEPKNSL